MKRYALPNTDLDLSVLCYGAGAFGTGLRGAALDRMVGAFLDAGGSAFDTAHCYAFWADEGAGASERALGECLRRLGRLDRAVVVTKGGHPAEGPRYPRPDGYLSPECLASDIADSLRWLGVERMDLYLVHRDDPRVPVGEIIEFLNVEIAGGRLRQIGASNWSTGRLAAANEYAARHGLRPFVASQVQWSLAVPNWRASVDPTMRFVTLEDAAWYHAADLPIMAYSATAGGYFGGRGHESGAFADAGNRARHDRARRLAAEIGATPTQVALAYLLCQEATVIPVFSTCDPAHLAEILAATEIRLSAEQVRWLREGE